MARAQLIGISARDFLRLTDPFEVLVIQAVTARAEQILEDMREDLAVRIANNVGKLFSRNG